MKLDKNTLIGGGTIIGVIILLIWLFTARVASHPASIKTNTAATSSLSSSTPAKDTGAHVSAVASPKAPLAHIPATVSKQNPLPIDQRDKITSWRLSITESTTTKGKLQIQIKTLTGDIGTGRYPNFSIYAQIAQNYALLGNGQSAYNFYIRAAKNDPSRGLPFSNIGNLMEELGAYHTAQNAFAKSVALQPKVETFWLSYLRFLSAHVASAPETVSIFTAAKKATVSAPDILIAEANWRAQIGNISGAIADWKLVQPQVGASQRSAIVTEIAKLKKSQL